VSNALTRGIRVTVSTEYLAEQSMPGHYVFAYKVRIANEGVETVQLRTRHWIITDAKGEVREVKGDGVVGAQPILGPGVDFVYESGCVLTTPRGTMHGTYQMYREDGTFFDAEIAPFVLAAPTQGRESSWLH
jgi:ApaG protein